MCNFMPICVYMYIYIYMSMIIYGPCVVHTWIIFCVTSGQLFIGCCVEKYNRVFTLDLKIVQLQYTSDYIYESLLFGSVAPPANPEKRVNSIDWRGGMSEIREGG